MKPKKPQLKTHFSSKSILTHYLLNAFIADDKDWEKLRSIVDSKKTKARR